MNKAKYYKHPQYGMVFGEDTLTPTGRLVWPSLETPKDPPAAKEGQAPGQPRFEVTLLLDKSSEKVKSFYAEMERDTKEMVALFNHGTKGSIMTPARLFADGDAFDLEKYPYYKNCWVIAARNKDRTKIAGPDGQALVEPKDLLGGMVGRLNVQPLITSHGISFKLKATQLVKDDGQRFGGGFKDPTGFFTACDSEDTEECDECDSDSDSKCASDPSCAKEGTLSEPVLPSPAVTAEKVATKKGKEAMINLL